MTLDRRRLAAALLPALLAAGPARAAPSPRVAIETGLGPIVVELYPDKAPVTVANFLRYVDAGSFRGGSFYRVVRPDNDRTPAISVIQGGMKPADGVAPPFPPIAHEPTGVTGLRHLDGTISMARAKPGTAASEFFICLGANPVLDQGGARNPDGQGFAAFGRVVEGMAVVRRINGLKGGQYLPTPVKIVGARRR